MDTTSGNNGSEYMESLVECPKHKAACLVITVADCARCPEHRGVQQITVVGGIEVFDVICGLPSRRRVSRLIREHKKEIA